jgi:type III secretion protein R
MAMGMSMVQPTLISVPLKLLLFVAVAGWSRLMHGMILSYN